ncbi:MAG: hypothetical protein ABFR47_08325 [Verrucomicrobiota bacterium]
MKKTIIIAAVAVAITAIISLKLSRKASDAPQACPCSLMKSAVSNQTDSGASSVE